MVTKRDYKKQSSFSLKSQISAYTVTESSILSIPDYSFERHKEDKTFYPKNKEKKIV